MRMNIGREKEITVEFLYRERVKRVIDVGRFGFSAHWGEEGEVKRKCGKWHSAKKETEANLWDTCGFGVW